MEAVTAQDPQALVPQLEEARAKLDALERDLRAIDAELEGLADERRQHRLLADACEALTGLRETGGAALFWGAGTAVNAGDDQLQRARTRLDAFQGRLGKIEGRRAAVVDEIRRQENDTWLLEDDLFDAQEEEERRQQEWVVEREISDLSGRRLIMPWTRGGEDDRRYRKSLAAALIVTVLFALIVPWIDLPLLAPDMPVEVPDRVVRMMMKERPKPPPPPREELKPQVHEKLAEQKPVEKAVPQRTAKVVEEAPVETPSEVKESEKKGILGFREKLAAFNDAEIVSRLGSKARIDNADHAATGRPERSMLTTNAPGSSGGIALASLSRGLGGGGGGAGDKMAGVQTTRATSAIGGGAGASDRPLARDGRAGRTDEEIQIVFDRYKAALYRLYNRELRKDPSLRGQMVLRLTIEPDGSVSLCQLQASDMNAPDLSAQVVERVRTINFGAKDVDPITILYPIDFLPAA
jgi:hypothetical protein